MDGAWTEDTHPATRKPAEFIDCPGCKKCSPHGGYVLRKGAWRPTRSTESIFLFAKGDRYYCDGEAVKNRARDATVMRDRYGRVLDDPDEQYAVAHDHETVSGGTANVRNWVVIKGEPLKESHYASFPSGIPRLAIKAGTSQKGVCPHCGSPWARVVERAPPPQRADYDGKMKDTDAQGAQRRMLQAVRGARAAGGDHQNPFQESRTLGWRQTCDCPEHRPIPATVLDPFMGSGTTGVAAEKCNRRSIGIDLSEEYVEIAAKRVRKARKTKGFGIL